jgi:hypothetical protein
MRCRPLKIVDVRVLRVTRLKLRQIKEFIFDPV